MISHTRRHFFRVAAASGALFLSAKQRQAKASGCLSFYTGQYLCCFLAGTHILTEDGDAQIDTLAAGDILVTNRGRMPVKRIVSFRSDEAPVRVKARALDGSLPRRDLCLTASHCLYVDGVLIPARDLVNEASIAFADDIAGAEYFHIELETHEAIHAEGALAETLLAEHMTPYAPIVRYDGGRSELKALLRRLSSPFVDIRDPIQVAYDSIAAL